MSKRLQSSHVTSESGREKWCKAARKASKEVDDIQNAFSKYLVHICLQVKSNGNPRP